MFTRHNSNHAKSIDDIKPIDKTFERTLDGLRPGAELPPRNAYPATPSSAISGPAASDVSRPGGTYSIIGNDLTIVGQGLRIITRGTLQVEGKIEGDVVGNEVIIGEQGHVTGVVSANTVVVHGAVAGTVKGLVVTLKSSARVDGDVHHQQLSVDQGAHLEGRVHRPADASSLAPDLD